MPQNKFWLPLAVCLLALPVFADEPPFKPFWTGELSVGYGAEDGGQQGGQVVLTGIDHLNPQGGFFEAALFSQTQLLEKEQAASYGFEAGGGVGLGDLVPFLLVNLEHGDLSYSAIRVKVGADKTLSPALQMNFFLTGEVTSHEGPLGAYVGLSPGSPAEVDDLDAIGGVDLKWRLGPSLSLTTTFQFESDETVKIQDPAHTVENEVDCAESIESLFLKPGWDFAPGWRIFASGQLALDSAPAGTFYSKRQGGTLTQASAQTTVFAGLSMGLAFQF